MGCSASTEATVVSPAPPNATPAKTPSPAAAAATGGAVVVVQQPAAPAAAPAPAPVEAASPAAPVPAAVAPTTNTTAAAAADTTSSTADTNTTTDSAAAQPDLSISGLLKSDQQLKDSKEFQAANAIYNKIASDASVEAAAKSLNDKKQKASVVSDAKAAVDLVASLIPQRASVGFGYSTTFNEIGINDYFKGRDDLHNFRSIALAAEAKNDWAAAGAARAQGASADYFLTSANAIGEDGSIIIADASGSRTAGILAAKNVILVVGANKIVPTEADGKKRLHEFVFPVESARVRVVFNAPSSAVNNEVLVRAGNPWGAPGRIHVIIIKGKSYGF